MNKNIDIATLREDYSLKRLEESSVDSNPFEQFKTWFQEALDSEVLEPNAMTLATATKEGRPAARIVLLKGFDEKGFVFYTNYESHKGQQLLENPFAALVFGWLPLQRQVRIEGKVEKVSFEHSENYFQSRPKGSQIGAYASPQSQIITDRSILEQKVTDLQTTYADVDKLPCPSHWGGYRLVPDMIEFWQGRRSRLHDRIRYNKDIETWNIVRLAP